MSRFGTIHIDTALTDVSIGYPNQHHARQIFPVLPVGKQTGVYWKHDKSNFRRRDTQRAAGTEANATVWTKSTDAFNCGGHGLKIGVSREDQANADQGLDLLVDSTEQLTDQSQLDEDISLVEILDAGMTGDSVENVIATPWNNDANDPLEAWQTAAEEIALAIGRVPNKAALPLKVFNAIRKNACIRSRITGASDLKSSMVTREQLAALFEVDELIVLATSYDTANEGQTASADWVWGQRALLYYQPPSPGQKTVSLGYTMEWRNAGLALGGANVGGQFVRRWFDDKTMEDYVEVDSYYDQKIIDKAAGRLFTHTLGS